MNFQLNRPWGACVLFTATASVSVFAQSFSSDLGEVFVTANRWGQRTDQVQADIEVLRREDIQRMGATSLADLLGRLSGVQSTSYGQSSVYIRGAEARMTAVYVDGVRVESHDGMRLGGGAPLDLLPLSAIERIELVKGARSSIYGSDAMGGVIQVFTVAAARDQQRAQVEWGGMNTRSASASLSHRLSDSLDLSVQVGTRQTDGYNTRPDVVHVPGKEANRQDFASAHLGLRIDSQQRLDFQALNVARDEKMVSYNGVNDISQKSSLGSGSIKWQMAWDDEQVSTVQWGQSSNRARSDAPNEYDLPNDYQTMVSSLSAQHRVQMGASAVLFNSEWKKDQFTAAKNDWNAAIGAERSQRALGAAYEWKQGPHALDASIRHDDYEHLKAVLNSSLGYRFNLPNRIYLSAARSTGFRAPTMEQIYGQYGSTSLQPESSVSQEVAAGQRQADSDWRLSVFQSDYKQLISSAMDQTVCGAGMFCYYNVDRAQIQGVSFKTSRDWGAVRTRLNIDHLDPKNLTNGKQLSLRARDTVQLSLSTLLAGVDTEIQWMSVGKRFDDAKNTVSLPAYSLVNLYLRKSLSPQWRAWLSVQNLTNRAYSQLGCTPMVCTMAAPGRAAYIGLEWRSRN